MAGPVWIAGGFVTMISVFLGKYSWIIFAVVMIVLILVPTIYSFMLYRKSEQR